MRRPLASFAMKISFQNSSLITIPVILFGTRKTIITMALDTGATYTMIPWKVAQALGFQPERTGPKINITTASSTEQAPLVTISRLLVFKHMVSNIEAVVHDLPPTSRIDGLLGLNAMRALKVKIDFSREEITF